jgi:hypothetical protein
VVRVKSLWEHTAPTAEMNPGCRRAVKREGDVLSRETAQLPTSNAATHELSADKRQLLRRIAEVPWSAKGDYSCVTWGVEKIKEVCR